MSTWVTGTTVVENSTSIENNTSNVTITLIVGWNGGSWAADNPRYYINVNGQTKKTGTANFNTSEASSGSQTIATWTGDVPHNQDGTGSMTWAVGYEGIYSGEGIYSQASGTKTLTTIDRGMMRIKVGGAWKKGLPYVKVGGTWKLGQAFIKAGGSWKRGI